MISYQTTLACPVSLSGIGVHGGELSRLEIRPASANHGIVFIRLMPDGTYVRLEAIHSQARSSALCTTLGQGQTRIETIEHLLAAARICAIDNLAIEISHYEVPILDGSAAPFVQAFNKAGVVTQAAPRHFLRILKPLRVAEEESWVEFLPYEAKNSLEQFRKSVKRFSDKNCGKTQELEQFAEPKSEKNALACRFDITIDFVCQIIGHQHIVFDCDRDFLIREIAPARTFGFQKDAEMLRARGLARGASLDNCLVIGEDGQLLNSQNLRFCDEFVRHKALDAIGDTCLLGKPFIGIFRGHRPSHRLNGAAVNALLASPEHFEVVEG